MKFKVIDVDEIEGELVIEFNSIDEKGKAITRGENAWFIELWRPKTFGLNIKKGDIFEIEFKPIENKEVNENE
jgi:hypothetical protein